jgi:hypothetical protein
MITSVGILSFRGISSWNSTLQQSLHYIASKAHLSAAATITDRNSRSKTI